MFNPVRKMDYNTVNQCSIVETFWLIWIARTKYDLVLLGKKQALRGSETTRLFLK